MTVLTLLKQGGIALIPLGFCSILVVAVILERMWTFARTGRVPKELMRRVEGLVAGGNWHEALRLLDDASSSPYARIAKSSLLRKNATKDELTDILALACDAEISTVARPLPILGTIGNIAPFIGLFGTVIGIMKAFHEIAQLKAAGSDVTAGISEALIATAVGLGVGIISVIANNWCNAWVERYRLELERFSTEWAYRLLDLQEQPVAKVKEPVA